MMELCETSPNNWRYVAEGGAHIVCSYSGPPHPQFDNSALRLWKVSKFSDKPSHLAAVSQPSMEEDDTDDVADPAVEFHNKIIPKLVSPRYLVPMMAIGVERSWLERLAAEIQEDRPTKRRMVPAIDINKRQAILTVDLVGVSDWAVEIKPKWGFLPHPTHLSPRTLLVKTRHCRFCMHSQIKQARGEVAPSEYCPLDLFSGDEGRVTQALRSLWTAWIDTDGSINNLRVFAHGQIIAPHDTISMTHLAQWLNSNEELLAASDLSESFIAALLPTLLHSPVLRDIADLQRSLDPLDIEGLSELWSRYQIHQAFLPTPLAVTMHEPTINDWEAFVTRYLSSHRTLNHDRPDVSDTIYYVLAYILSAIFKDCSIFLRPESSGTGLSISLIDLDAKKILRLSKWSDLDSMIVDHFVDDGKTNCVDALS